MALEISGKVLQLLQEQTGSGKNGAWVRRDVIIETVEQYPKKVCISCWGDKATQLNTIQPGQMVKIAFNVESREFNGKWYNDIRAWRIDTNVQAGNGGEVPDYMNQPETFPSNGGDSALPQNTKSEDDLPF